MPAAQHGRNVQPPVNMDDEEDFTCFYYDSDEYIREDYYDYDEFDGDRDEDESEDDESRTGPSTSNTNDNKKPFVYVPTPLLNAVSSGKPVEMIRPIFQDHPDALEQERLDGMSHLHIAAMSRPFDVVQFLARAYPQALEET
jgi:hypothetical protein